MKLFKILFLQIHFYYILKCVCNTINVFKVKE